MDRTPCTEPQCMYKGALYLSLTIRLCANMCVHACVYVRVSVTHARVLTSGGLGMLAEHRNTQAMSSNVNTSTL